MANNLGQKGNRMGIESTIRWRVDQSHLLHRCIAFGDRHPSKRCASARSACPSNCRFASALEQARRKRTEVVA